MPLFYLYEVLTVEGQAFSLLTLIAGAMGVDVSATDAHLVWAAATALLLTSLLLSRRHRLHGVRLEVVLPRRVSVGEEVTFTLVVRNEGVKARHGLRFDGPFLPWDGRWTGERPALAVLPAGGSEKVTMRARFSQRGEHHLDSFRAGELVPLGLTLGPPLHSPDCRLLVVPHIANVVRLSTPIGRRHQPGGVALASRTGESMDLRGVRPYRPGDAVRDLHARSWARLGTPVVREYQQEYFSRIGVIVDTDLRDDDPERLEAALQLCAGVVGRLSRGEALIDLLVVGGRVHTLTLGRSLGTFEQALDLLACVEAGPPLSAELLLSRMAPHLLRLSCLVVIALRWDEERGRLCERVRARGVGCRTLLLGGAPGKAAGGDGEVVTVPMAAITGGEGLFL